MGKEKDKVIGLANGIIKYLQDNHRNCTQGDLEEALAFIIMYSSENMRRNNMRCEKGDLIEMIDSEEWREMLRKFGDGNVLTRIMMIMEFSYRVDVAKKKEV